jgi:hypothetical protein
MDILLMMIIMNKKKPNNISQVVGLNIVKKIKIK